MSINTNFTKLENPALTVDEALRISGFDWDVEKVEFPDRHGKIFKGKMTLERTDIQKSLSIVGNRYEPISNRDAFAPINDVLGQGHAQVERIGSLKDDLIVFIQAKMPESIEVLKGDRMDQYLNGITSHDGSFKTYIFFSGFRIFCQNQMGQIRRAVSQNRTVEISHTKSAKQNLAKASEILLEGAKHMIAIRENAQILARKSVNRAQTKKFIEDLFPMPKEEEARDHNAKHRETLAQLIECGKGTEIDGVRGSAWGLYNAGTEWYDHYSPARKTTNTYARSLLSGDKFRDKVFSLAMA